MTTQCREIPAVAAVPVPDPDRQRLRRVERDLLLVDADDGDDSRWQQPGP
jgi:hypothetical protein